MIILNHHGYLIRPFGACTVTDGERLLNLAWQFIDQKKRGILAEATTWESISGNEAPDLVVYNREDVESQRGHISLILEALQWFISNCPQSVLKECHSTQSCGQADLWVFDERTKIHYVCEATDKANWDNFAKKKIRKGAGRGLNKRGHQIKILRELACKINKASDGSRVRTCHILRHDVAKQESRQSSSKSYNGSNVLVEFDAK